MIMTEKEIDRAAVDSCVFERDIYNPELIPYYEQGFKDGANWRINSVWHDIKETPQERRFCLYILKNGSYGCGYYYKRGNTIWYEQFEKVDKWAYFNDLIPNMEG